MCDPVLVFKKLEEYKPIIMSSLEEISDLDVSCMSVIERYSLNTTLLEPSVSIVKIQALIDYMHERVNIGNWKEVPIYLRKTITIATYLLILAHFKCTCSLSDDIIKKSFKIIDFGILFGCPISKEPLLLQKCASYINSLNVKNTIYNHIKASEQTKIEYKLENFDYTTLDVLNCPSMESFYKNYILAKTPIVIDNCMMHWPALKKWSDPNYFIKVAGSRTVPIELGKEYTDSNWTQKLITLEEFVKNYIYDTTGGTGYLAQYQLFEQIPELKDDIIEPEYCCFSDSDEPIDIMAWFGPKGTVSPLHHDPKKNLLAQVVGQKQIFLISPDDSKLLYPHEHELLNNTARVDPRNPDYDKYPNFKQAKVYYCILKEGQMLYIPPKWWHFVESLSVSFSVSFWWD